MRRLIPALVMSLLFLGLGVIARAGDASLTTPGDHGVDVTVGGFARHYLVHIPSGYDGKTHVPLVLFFHGAGGNSQQASKDYQWTEKADKSKFIAAFLDGLPIRPNAAPSFVANPKVWRDMRPEMRTGGVDDVAFVTQVLNDLEKSLAIDTHRVYATGFSNGAGMTFYLGTQLGNRLAAIAPVSSHLTVPVTHLSRPVPMIYFVGSADPMVPLAGGDVHMPWGNTTHRDPISKSIDTWVSVDGCASKPVSETTKNGVTCRIYRGEEPNNEVDYYEVAGNGHHWPGSHERLYKVVVGNSVNTIDATDVIWDFFSKHPLK